MDTHGDHSACDPDDCFAAKCRYWRSGAGTFAVSYRGGQSFFHGATIKERQGKIIADAAADGRQVRLKNPLYDK
jgi:hypothetical protein